MRARVRRIAGRMNGWAAVPGCRTTGPNTCPVRGFRNGHDPLDRMMCGLVPYSTCAQ